MKFLFEVKNRSFARKNAACVRRLQFAVSIVSYPIRRIELKTIIRTSSRNNDVLIKRCNE
jgi:hypothetical protein